VPNVDLEGRKGAQKQKFFVKLRRIQSESTSHILFKDVP
jgi:hypothetical protein